MMVQCCLENVTTKQGPYCLSGYKEFYAKGNIRAKLQETEELK